MNRAALLQLTFACALVACGDSATSAGVQQAHSSPMATSSDGTRLFVVHPDADSVSILDRASRAIVHEVRLAAQAPAVDPASMRFDPAVSPRAVALDSHGATAFVSGERSGRLYAIDAASGSVKGSVAVCSEPIGVVVSRDDAHVFVACSQDDAIVEVGAASLAIEGHVSCPRKPWSLAWGADGATLYATHLLGPGVSVLSTQPLALTTTWNVADGPPASDGDPTEPHGQVRGIYDAAIRPGTNELWVVHMMLGTDTPQPTLDFERTVFPAISVFDGNGVQLARLSVAANPGDNGALGDIVSGPHAITFSDDGQFAFVADTDSEDVLAIDAVNRVEASLVRPLPGHMPEGIVWDRGELYVQERNSEDVAAFQVDAADGGLSIALDGTPFKTLAVDPMPAQLRLGQKMFYSANSDDVPVTQNHWVACTSCHLEGRSTGVTWKVVEGLRDAPSNAGGMLGTGFLFRTADRSRVQDYWKTIDQEQGGHFSEYDQADPSQKALLDALADYVNYAIPVPVPPTPTDPQAVALGEQLFNDTTKTACTCCHSGPNRTDSGQGNSTLDLSGPILLHDVGTCVTGGPWPDVAHDDIDGQPRAACAFDTPALRGLSDSAPYLHDGSAATLDDVIPVMLQATAPSCTTPRTSLSAGDRAALVEYLRSL
jgi:DNA-binding beta-propeller fold protein YncE